MVVDAVEMHPGSDLVGVKVHNPSPPDVLTIFWVHIVVIALTFILRTLHRQELVADGLEQRLNSLEQRLE